MAERLFNRCVGPLAFAVDCADHEVGDRLESLFAGFVEADVDPTVIAVVVRERRGDTDGWHLRIDERGAGFFAEAHLLEEALTRRVNRLVLDAEPDRLHLHAGAVARDGHAVLVVGPSGSGKSTLVAGLVAAGWQLLSDEQLGVLTDGRLVAFPRPITLRRASWPLFADVVVDPPDDLARIEVPIAHVGEWYRGEPIAPTIIVRPDVSVAESSRRDLSAAEALGVLVSDTLDLERAGDDGLDALLALVTSGPMIRVMGTDLRASIDQIDQALAEAEPRRPATEASAATIKPETPARNLPGNTMIEVNSAYCVAV